MKTNFKVLAVASMAFGLAAFARAQEIEGSNAKQTQKPTSVEKTQQTTTGGQELDGSDLRKDLRERDERVGRLSTEDQLRLRAAEQKAAEDPEVKAAMERRNKAMKDFRAAVRAAVLKVDPSLGPILEKVAIDRR